MLEVPLPTDVLDWLATQEEVIKRYPYIKNCWLGPKGTGQPTVHVPVMALTVTSSVFLDSSETPTVESVEKGPTSSLTTKSTIRAIVTVMTSTPSSEVSPTTSSEIKQTSSHVARPESTETPQSEADKQDSDVVDADLTSAMQPEIAEQPQTLEGEEASPTFDSVSRQNDPSKDHSATSDHQGLISNSVNPVGPATITKSQSTATATPTAGFIEDLVSAIQSVVAQQGGVSQAEPNSKDGQKTTRLEPAAVVSTTVSEERPAEPVTGFAIGTHTASPGGEAVTRGGSVYSALPSGSGLRVVADGQTSTITAAVLPGVAVAQGSGSTDVYVVGDNTLAVGGPAITSDGNTLSALPAGSGVRIAASGQTRIVPAVAFTDSVTLRPGDSDDEYVFAGNFLSAGDKALDFAGVTYSALKSGSGIIIIAEESTSTASVGQAIGANFAIRSDLNSPSPLLLAAGLQQLVTSSAGISTASAILEASDESRNGTSTAISSNTTSSLQTTETSSSTRGLGDAIISGMGGGNVDDGDGDANTPDPPQSSTVVEPAASHVARRSVHVLLGGFCTFALALALL
jgi:hypothetical protein